MKGIDMLSIKKRMPTKIQIREAMNYFCVNYKKRPMISDYTAITDNLSILLTMKYKRRGKFDESHYLVMGILKHLLVKLNQIATCDLNFHRLFNTLSEIVADDECCDSSHIFLK